MKRVLRIDGKGKIKNVGLRGLDALPEADRLDAKVALIQALIPIGLEAVAEELEAEVLRLAGPKHKRTGGLPGAVRWCRQRGSIYLADQKLPISYQRVRDLPRNREFPLPTYQRFQHPRAADLGLFRKVLFGLSCRDYEAAGGGPGGLRVESLVDLPPLYPGERQTAPSAAGAATGRLRHCGPGPGWQDLRRG